MGDNFGEELIRVFTWPFDKQIMPEQDTSGSGAPAPITETQSEEEILGNVSTPSVDAQATQRRLARLSKYFTSPLGIMNDASTGSTGVF